MLDTIAQWLSLANTALQMVGMGYVLVLQLRPLQQVIRPKVAGMVRTVVERASSAVRSRRIASGRLRRPAAPQEGGEVAGRLTAVFCRAHAAVMAGRYQACAA